MSLAAGLVLMGFLAGVDYRRWRPLGRSSARVVAVHFARPGARSGRGRRSLRVAALAPNGWPTAGRPAQRVRQDRRHCLHRQLDGEQSRASRPSDDGLVAIPGAGRARGGADHARAGHGHHHRARDGRVTVFWVAGAERLHVASAAGLGVAAWPGWSRRPLTAPAPAGLDGSVGRSPGLGWHTVQTLMALGSGGLTGPGSGAGLRKPTSFPTRTPTRSSR